MARRLYPDAAELALDEIYAGLTLREPAPGRAWVALCMVASLDGAVSVEGRSGGLGGEADRLALSRLRGSNDVSVVGADTVRRERYSTLTGTSDRRRDRAARGLTPVPRLAIVSRSGQLDPQLPVFADPDHRPLLLVSDAADGRALDRLDGHAQIVPIGGDALNAHRVVEELVALGLRRILCEGGPRINQAMLAGDLVDEVFLTVAPTMIGGPATRIVTGDDEHVRHVRIVSVIEHDGDLLLRYRHARHGTALTPDA